jgi:hypothetical protein
MGEFEICLLLPFHNVEKPQKNDSISESIKIFIRS